MFRFKHLLFFILFLQLFALTAGAQATTSKTKVVSPKKNHPALWTLAIGYESWQEQLSLKGPSSQDTGNANFLGNNLTLSRISAFGGWAHHGSLFEASLVYGVVSAGGTQSLLTYQLANAPFYGLSGSWRLAYIVAPKVIMSAGPLFLIRQISYPNTPTSVTATSGSNFNYGLYGEVRETLFPHFELQQGMGTLLANASIIWSLGLGYHF